MSENTSLETLLALPVAELETRARRVTERFEVRAAQGRDLSKSELDAYSLELAELRVAIEQRARNDERLAAIDGAIDNHRRGVENRSRPTLLVSPENLREHAAALSKGQPWGAVEGVETRSLVTAAAELGSAGAWHPGAPQAPRHLVAFSGIPISPLVGRTAQVPRYVAPDAAVGVGESGDHPEFDDVTPINLTAARYGRWTGVSALADQVDELSAINVMHATGIARDLDRLAVQAVEAAADSLGVSVDVAEQAREAVLLVAAQTYSDPTSLVIIGTPAALAELVGTSPTNGDDVGSYALRFQGARLYATTAAATDLLTVFSPGGFRCFQSPLQSASLIDPSDGSHRFGSWLHATPVAEQIAGSAVMCGAS